MKVRDGGQRKSVRFSRNVVRARSEIRNRVIAIRVGDRRAHCVGGNVGGIHCRSANNCTGCVFHCASDGSLFGLSKSHRLKRRSAAEKSTDKNENCEE